MKNILITGAAGYLGEAVVKTFLKAGYRVIATVSSGNSLDYIQSDPFPEVYPVNAADPAAVKGFIGLLSARKIPVDALIHLVGGFVPGILEETSIEDLRRMMSLNFETAFNYLGPVMAKMKQQPGGGKIILVGSKPGKNPAEVKNAVAYALSKSLVFRLAEIINEEGGPASIGTKKITATVFVPGTIDTPANRKAMPDADFSKWNSPYELAGRMENIISGREEATEVEFS